MSIGVGTGALLMFGMGHYANMQQQSEDWKKRIRTKWEESKNYPRKKKKRVRKELLVEWSIACYDPFDGFNFKF
jgi:ABC-type phosphonate transport system ATPase subunit